MSAFTLVILGLLMTTCHSQYQQPPLGSNSYEDYDNAYNKRQEEAPLRNYANVPTQREGKAIAAKPTPPVAILKQINRHNEDGSYTYGFEGADGSFKIETKLANGEVKGKYGFVDDTGKVRVVEYGANQYGFQPAGEGITVAPPTLVDETTDKNQQPIDYDYPQGPTNLKQQEIPRPAPPPPQQQQPRPAQRPQYQPPEAYATQPKRPIFTPAAQSQFSQQFDYEERPPVSQALNQGPVQFNPAPAREAQPSSLGRNVQRAAHNAGVLDQLAREYALPQDAAAPLHDISFGYYK